MVTSHLKNHISPNFKEINLIRFRKSCLTLIRIRFYQIRSVIHSFLHGIIHLTDQKSFLEFGLFVLVWIKKNPCLSI